VKKSSPKGTPGMDGPGMDAPGMKEMGGMSGAGAAKAKSDPARLQAQIAFMKARRLGEDAAKLRAAGAAAKRATLDALRVRFDRLDRSLRAVKTADASIQQLIGKARTQLDTADRALIDVRLSLDLERAKTKKKKQPAPTEDF